MTVRIAARVTGRVQGVGFRHFTRREARSLDLSGWVRNEPDGSVRLEVEGPDDDVQAFLEQVRSGPRAGWVDRVETSERPVHGETGPFRVEH